MLEILLARLLIVELWKNEVFESPKLIQLMQDFIAQFFFPLSQCHSDHIGVFPKINQESILMKMEA